MCLTSNNSAKQTADQQRMQEELRQGRIAEGRKNIDSAFSGFDDNFYSDRTQDYIDWSKPQIQDQYSDAVRQLRSTLAGSQLTNSSVGARKRAQLQKELDKATSEMVKTAKNYTTNQRQGVEAARSELQSQNMNLANPTLIAQQAINRAEMLNEIPNYSPIAKLFADATEGLATQIDLERRGKNRYDTPSIFNFGGSSRIVG